jgi:phosphomannomutase
MVQACSAAFASLEIEVDLLGVLPTPAVAWHERQHHCPAVMVTGSHIPFDHNGIKFYDANDMEAKCSLTVGFTVRSNTIHPSSRMTKKIL